MADPIKKGLPLDQLGLPPMELAESSDERNSRFLYRCLYPTLQKVFILLFIVTFSAGTYILLMKLLESTEPNSRNTEIIIVTGLKDSPNITLHDSDMHIIFQLGNVTSEAHSRRKRNVNERHANLENLNEKDLLRVKDIITQHQNRCHKKEHEKACKELVMKLQSIIESHEDKQRNTKDLMNQSSLNINHPDEVMNAAEVTKREAQAIGQMRGVLSKGIAPIVPLDSHPTNPHIHIGAPSKITDTCLLAKLLKRSYPHVHGIYDSSTPELMESHLDQQPQMRYFQPSPHPYFQSREMDSNRQKLHQQDVDIILGFLSPKAAANDYHQANATSRDVDCPPGAVPCGNSEDCIDEKQWCDGRVDCSDASDEVRCSCKSRVDESRLCDGYFDCPFGEDEMGCNGCSENTFSCENIDLQSHSTCYTKEQRCNNVIDCPNHKDEIECNMLAPSLLKKPVFAVSNTEGFLQRNFGGDWYAVCQNPYMWAHDACRRETGLMIRPPFIQIVPIDPLLKVNYLSTGPGGFIQPSDTCFNSSAVYVTCPDFLCGTRVSTTSQLLRENVAVENHLFGRNKRFLYPGFPGHPYDSYRMMYYGNRVKRDTSATDVDASMKYIDSIGNSDTKTDERNKRAESRVVGGKPSQPTDWPWMVAIYRDGMFHCGGIVLTQDWVISAAHCVAKFWDHYYEIKVGMLRRFSFSPQEQNHRVSHIIVNQRYNQVDMKDDLSLLKVEPSIQFSRWIRPICLPGPNTAGPNWKWGPLPDTICTAVGWGATIEHGPDPDHLREVEVPIWDKCKHREDRAGREICAGLPEGGKDACQGDSGGPLLCRNPLNSQQWYLAGIVSHGDGCARKNEPGVYTRVSLFVKWIKYHTNSKTLPLVQPIQECPGFKCKSGLSRCLPLIRKCDKVVDCLDAEDEINCDFNEMRSSNNILPTIKNSTIINKSSEKRESVTSSESSSEETSINEVNKSTAESIPLNSFHTSTDVSITTHDNHVKKPVENTIDDSIPDFEHSSTIEVSPSTSFEQFESDSTETATADPTTNNDISERRGDTESIAVSFTSEKLESRSSVLADKDNRRTDIEEDNATTTVSSIQDSATQTSDVTIITNEQDQFGQENTISEINSEKPIDNFETKSEPFVVALLPKTDNSTENIADNEKKEIDQVASESNTDSLMAKELPDLESKNIDNIENLVFPDLQPASIRRKHRVPKEFKCRRILQMIPFNQRCDHKADCEDGTDELDCTCSDYLSTYDENVICDGIFDCADGQDESDCYSCPEQHLLCKHSEICLPMKYVCDGTAQCPLGEDERNCFALSNGREMFYDIDEKPKISLEGYLTKRNADDWQVVCENNLSVEQQEQSATYICHYLGFSSANRYSIKYINVKEESLEKSTLDEKRTRRNSKEGKPIHFAYKNVESNSTEGRNIVIKEPQLLKEECVPNVTKTCKSLYVYCDRSLYTNFDVSQNLIYNRAADTPQNVTTHMWPWIAKIYLEGHYKCTGILVDSSWVLVSHACLWDASPVSSFITVVLGSHRTLNLVGSFEKAHKVDAKKELFTSKVVLLHLKTPAEYSNYIKPMIVSSHSYHPNQKMICVAVGQDNRNNTISIFLNETTKNCNLSNRCFIRKGKDKICSNDVRSGIPWAGLVSCHNDQGWHPVASFVDSRGECGIGETIVATDIENLRQELRYYSGKLKFSLIESASLELTDNDVCEGVRCSRGRCISLKQLCDGVMTCEDGNDETEESCKIKRDICEHDPFLGGCECSLGQMKCRNGKCISKELFRDGNDDCGDGTDEPMRTTCSDYLARVTPSRLCDGILHCHDRSDEDPMYCKCFAKHNFKCGSKSQSENNEVEHCVAPDMVCDGVRDCPNAEDERTCIGLSAPEGTLYGIGQVMVRSHGIWRSKCYPTQNHTKSELEAICRELGFLSGHAKEIKEMKNIILNTPNNLALEPFSEVILNNNTTIRMRNTNVPIAKAVFDEDLKHCYPVFIECI